MGMRPEYDELQDRIKSAYEKIMKKPSSLYTVEELHNLIGSGLRYRDPWWMAGYLEALADRTKGPREGKFLGGPGA